MTHGTLVKIMANHNTWNACQDHGKILTKQPWFVMVLTKEIMSKNRLNHFQLLTVSQLVGRSAGMSMNAWRPGITSKEFI